MPKKKVLIANWKMHHSLSSATEYFWDYFSYIKAQKKEPDVHVSFAVPFTLLASVHTLLATSSCTVAAQNFHWQEKGAFTGEISLPMLSELGVASVLIGHSERRQYFAETDATAALKTKAALGAGFSPVLCIGEHLAQRQNNSTAEVVRGQLSTVLKELSAPASLIIAYEPIWAIGTGLAASPQQAQEVHQLIREILREFFGEKEAQKVPILYGGSVTLANIGSFMQQRDIDGALVGGASLQGTAFAQMACSLSAL
jgi:triosephosphate isomerase